jgi:translation initiation factor 2B subunit (eIF-2B alpha/beta/delta family)
VRVADEEYLDHTGVRAGATVKVPPPVCSGKMQRTPVVTVFCRHRGEVLLLRRSEAVGSYTGTWGAVAGHLADDEGVTRDPVVAARAEIREETGIADADVSLVRAGEPFDVDDGERRWRVHPFLFDCAARDVTPNEETTEFEWCSPTELLRRETVPRLWTSYDHVRPTVETVTEDTDHGSAFLSYRALECLRDEAALRAEGRADGDGSVREVALSLRDARPAMAVVENRVNRAVDRAGAPEDPAAVERAASEALAGAFDADERAAAWPDSLDVPESVLTLSRSGTVRAAIESADPSRVFVAESGPAREGVGVAESLAEGRAVTLHTDAAIGHVLATEAVDAVVVGADAVLADGSVVNKTGTRLAALAAAREGVAVYVVCAADKVTPREDPHLESGSPGAVYDGDAPLSVVNPTFDVTPADLVTGVLTDHGVLDTASVAEVASEHASLGDWTDW